MPGAHSHSHSERYFTQVLIGFASLAGFVFLTYYAIFQVKKEQPWYFWAAAGAFLLLTGIYFCMSAFVHKVKSDFNRRAKQREQHRTFMADN
ncbi:MAG: DUF2892 domain-containing protein [Chitinophagaceae bacterium]|nr:DUF2892 domain-containing protein [Chitinophagaceae bacterium]